MSNIGIFTGLCDTLDMEVSGFELRFPEDAEWADDIKLRTEQVYIVNKVKTDSARPSYILLNIVETADFAAASAIEKASIKGFHLSIIALDTDSNPVKVVWDALVEVNEVSVLMNSVDKHKWVVKLVKMNDHASKVIEDEGFTK